MENNNKQNIAETNKSKDSEERILIFVGKILDTPFNLSIVILSIAWYFLVEGKYWNSNFDILSTAENHIYYVSLLSIIIGAVTNNSYSEKLMRLGTINTVVTAITLSASKAINTSEFAPYIIPVNMFLFFYILKNIWLASFEIKVKYYK